MKGLFLEDDGNVGTAFSHWEFQMFGRDIMAGIGILAQKLSEFTLAAFQDMGLYHINFDYADWIYRGNQAGCFLLQNRINNRKLINEMCVIDGSIGCSADTQFITYCSQFPLTDSIFQKLPIIKCTNPNNSIDNGLFNVFGESSRCVNILFGDFPFAACYEVQCMSDHYQIKIDQQILRCEKANKKIKFVIGDFELKLVCPEFESLCEFE